ncbi:TrmB family transcriptional regulator [Petrocella atlantisensis]|uniref:TrmB family transcriptional regulator n=1 Tax=Petrocella atlantisensis TaxID=2173034 RepID=A0A3P7NTC7_9FIRM|nr:helix-turn-helix domain-containing protein [Petrocella atlantisensis]VDN46474.1 TrmB family transcriptional regulator [Petrocella atlantisensis]
MELVNALKKIGFTQQEAIIYIELCRHHEITGYEAAKLSGISRSNAYAALSSLVDKGYAYVIEAASMKYTPVPKVELIKNAKRSFEEQIIVIEEKLDFSQLRQEPYVTIADEKHIINKLKNIIQMAELRIYLSCDNNVLEMVKEEIHLAVTRGLKVVILSPKDLNGIKHTHYFNAPSTSIKIIADTKEVLAGTLKQSLYSKNSTLVHLIREAFINEITILESQEKQ